jgi:RNA polymerase sigma-70 factor (ECF subfamily)
MLATKEAPVTDQARAVWDLHYRPLAGYCASILASADLGAEVAAEAFVRLWSRWSSVDDPRGFLYVVATNLCRDHWRRAARERRAVHQLGHGLTDVPAVDPWLRDLVDRLPDKLRKPVLLHYYADLPVAEVARALHRPEGTVKRQLSEARALLADSIEDLS